MTPEPLFPELVTRRRDQFVERGWTVREGWALRGHASCDFVDRVIEVPLGQTPVERVIRAHELIHARVSPHDVNPLEVYREIPPRALECAEEFRVNELLGRLGFDVSCLFDGSERAAGLRLASNDAWDEAAMFFVAIMGTGAEREFLRGVRKAAPDWTKALSVIRRRVRSFVDGFETADVAATDRDVGLSEVLPRGFDSVTVPIAKILTNAAGASSPGDVNELRRFRRSLEPGGRRAPTGKFAQLVFDEGLDYRAAVVRRTARRLQPSVTGTSLRYPSRLLTDPQRRALARTKRAPGGVVLIDQSGSMDVDADEIARLLTVAPAATLIGYSHRPGSTTNHANAWVLARDGRRARTAPTGNVGNGVDGPALRWAIRNRRAGDRVIWVTDGQVTDSNDHPDRALAAECAQLVRTNRVALVRTIAQVDAVLRGRPAPETPIDFGRVGRELERLA